MWGGRLLEALKRGARSKVNLRRLMGLGWFFLFFFFLLSAKGKPATRVLGKDGALAFDIDPCVFLLG